MPTRPATCAGDVTTIWVLDLTVHFVAVVLPNVTFVTVEKPVPVTVTLVPPATGPVVRDREVMVGPVT